jgi:hypothetical protein
MLQPTINPDLRTLIPRHQTSWARFFRAPSQPAFLCAFSVRVVTLPSPYWVLELLSTLFGYAYVSRVYPINAMVHTNMENGKAVIGVSKKTEESICLTYLHRSRGASIKLKSFDGCHDLWRWRKILQQWLTSRGAWPSVVRPLLSSERPHFQTYKPSRVPEGLETKDDCAGEDQQQFIRLDWTVKLELSEGPKSRQVVKYGTEFLGTRNEESLCWRGQKQFSYQSERERERESVSEWVSEWVGGWVGKWVSWWVRESVVEFEIRAFWRFQGRQIVIYSHESRGTRNQESLCCRGTATIYQSVDNFTNLWSAH